MKLMFLFLLFPIFSFSQEQYSIADLKNGKFKLENQNAE